MKKKVFRINLFLLLVLVMLLSASCGRNRATTMKLIKTDGEVGVENEKGKSVDLIENLGLYNGYGIGTQPKSFAWIVLDDTNLTHTHMIMVITIISWIYQLGTMDC